MLLIKVYYSPRSLQTIHDNLANYLCILNHILSIIGNNHLTPEIELVTQYRVTSWINIMITESMFGIRTCVIYLSVLLPCNGIVGANIAICRITLNNT